MKLQDPLVIRGNTIKNRIVMEPMMTFSFHGDNGFFTAAAVGTISKASAPPARKPNTTCIVQ